MKLKKIGYLIYYLFYKFIVKNQYRENLGLWFYKDGNSRFLLNHKLNSSSFVFEIGGYVGVFTQKTMEAFNPNIYVFEPVSRFYDVLVQKFKKHKKIKLFDFGLSNKTQHAYISLSGDKSSFSVKSDRKERVRLVDIHEFISSHREVKKIDLMSINIEGDEYMLLKRIIDTHLIKKISKLQVQFHLVDKTSVTKRKMIINKLMKTHKVDYSFPFIWECFVKK